MAQSKKNMAERREKRVRFKLAQRNKTGRPRLTVFRSNQQIYAQIIDDRKGHTVASASTLEKELRSKTAAAAGKESAAEVGRLIAERAKKAGTEKVFFDRGSYSYHGRIVALAESARKAGLEF